jgi:hypothetical protein
MRNLFETKKITEVIFFEEFGNDVKITMQKNKCFEIRQYNVSIKYWSLCYETSKTCSWENAVNLAKSLIK